MNTFPETFEIDRIYKFERTLHGRAEEARLIIFDNGTARILGALDYSYDMGPQAWERAVKRLKEDGFNFKEAWKQCAMEDFPPQPGENPLDALKRSQTESGLYFRILDLRASDVALGQNGPYASQTRAGNSVF